MHHYHQNYPFLVSWQSSSFSLLKYFRSTVAIIVRDQLRIVGKVNRSALCHCHLDFCGDHLTSRQILRRECKGLPIRNESESGVRRWAERSSHSYNLRQPAQFNNLRQPAQFNNPRQPVQFDNLRQPAQFKEVKWEISTSTFRFLRTCKQMQQLEARVGKPGLAQPFVGLGGINILMHSKLIFARSLDCMMNNLRTAFCFCILRSLVDLCCMYSRVFQKCDSCCTV